jgi:outer membrane lipoprotein-sorting protein
MKIYNRSIVAAIAALFVFGAVAATPASAQAGLREILNRMENYNKNLTTLRAQVTMGKQNAQLGDEPEIQSGTAIYAKRPGKDALVRIDWTRPLEESLAIADGKYIMYRKKLGVAYTGSVKDKTKDSKGTSAFAFMNMSKAQLSANYDVKYIGAATLSDGTPTIQLELTPKVKTSYKLAQLWVDKDGMPRQSKITETNNDTTQVLLSHLEPNIKLTRPDFEIAPPKGTTFQKS